MPRPNDSVPTNQMPVMRAYCGTAFGLWSSAMDAALDPTYYQRVAPVYDAIRFDDGDELDRTVSEISQRLELQGLPLLEVGGGTGRYLSALTGLGGPLICLDLSVHQLVHASKSVAGVQGTATKLPLRSASVGLCAHVMMLHQLPADHLLTAMSESFRVLAPGGLLFIKTASHSDIISRPFADIFPSGTAANLIRYPEISQIAAAASASGFTALESFTQSSVQRQTGSDFVKAIELQHTSTLALVPDDERRAGIEKVRQLLTPLNEVHDLPISHTLLFATKPRCS